MAGQVLADLEALRSLQAGLSQFNHGANEIMSQVASELLAARERIEARTSYWQAELRRREAALRDCMSSDSEDCRRERMVVDEASEALQTLRRLASVLEQVSGEYNSQQSRFKQAVDTNIGKGKADLERSLQKYEGYLESTSLGIGGSGYSSNQEQLANNYNKAEVAKSASTSITWAERQAIENRFRNGEVITIDELNKLKLPISDLQTTTAVDLQAQAQQLKEMQQFYQAMGDSREAQDLSDAILAVLKALKAN